MEIQDILRNLQIEQLTPMQEATREAYRENKDLVLLSPTGSGKTLAFLLPLVQTLKTDVQGVQAVVLVPSRELALQIETVFKSMGTPFKAMSCYGGRPAMEEDDEGDSSFRHYRYAGTNERSSTEREFRCGYRHHIGDR